MTAREPQLSFHLILLYIFYFLNTLFILNNILISNHPTPPLTYIYYYIVISKYVIYIYYIYLIPIQGIEPWPIRWKRTILTTRPYRSITSLIYNIISYFLNTLFILNNILPPHPTPPLTYILYNILFSKCFIYIYYNLFITQTTTTPPPSYI